jgi:hypothetical protein
MVRIMSVQMFSESPARRLFIRTVSTFLYGVDAATWRRILRETRFAVDLEYAPRAGLITLASLYNSLIKAREDRRFGAAVAAVEVQPPLVIVGHWRSGTTHLHRLLAQDPRFAFPNLHQVRHPHTFLSTERLHSRLADGLLPGHRPADAMPVTHQLPEEDEFALANLTGYSLIVGGVFPRRRADYLRYLTFRDVPKRELETWQQAFTWFLKKLSWKYQRPLVLKAPYHTARLGLLRGLFPGVRFVHLHRDPYDVYKSTWHSTSLAGAYNRVQRTGGENLESYILDRYRLLYDAFFEERPRVEADCFDVRFEQLEREPLRVLRALYAHFDLPDFELARPNLERYLQSVSGYQKNRYPELSPALRRKIGQVWERSFETWGYPR